MDKESIVRFLNNNKDYLYEEFGVVKIGIFGSFAQDNMTKNSDIDIVVEFSKERKNLHNFLELKRYLERKFKRKVDLGIESNLKSSIRQKVKSSIIYA